MELSRVDVWIHMQDYKSLRPTVMISAILVNKHTHRQLLTRYILSGQPATGSFSHFLLLSDNWNAAALMHRYNKQRIRMDERHSHCIPNATTTQPYKAMYKTLHGIET